MQHIVRVSVEKRPHVLRPRDLPHPGCEILIRFLYIGCPTGKVNGVLWQTIRSHYAVMLNTYFDIALTPFWALNAVYRLHHEKVRGKNPRPRWDVQITDEAKRYLEDAAAEKIAREGTRAGKYVNLFWKPTPNL